MHPLRAGACRRGAGLQCDVVNIIPRSPSGAFERCRCREGFEDVRGDADAAWAVVASPVCGCAWLVGATPEPSVKHAMLTWAKRPCGAACPGCVDVPVDAAPTSSSTKDRPNSQNAPPSRKS